MGGILLGIIKNLFPKRIKKPAWMNEGEYRQREKANRHYWIEGRNAYLEKIGLFPYQYGTNFMLKKDMCRHIDVKKTMRWTKQHKKYGFDDRETYDLCRTHAEWLYSHIMMYRERAGKVIDFSFWKIEYNGAEYSQMQCMEMMLSDLKYYLIHGDSDDNADAVESMKRLCRAMEIWTLIMSHMWW